MGRTQDGETSKAECSPLRLGKPNSQTSSTQTDFSTKFYQSLKGNFYEFTNITIKHHKVFYNRASIFILEHHRIILAKQAGIIVVLFMEKANPVKEKQIKDKTHGTSLELYL